MVAKRRIDKRCFLLAIFAFIVAAAFGFSSFKNSEETSAINAAYAGFEAGNIISDYVMSDYNSMDEGTIQAFLKSKAKCDQRPDGNHVSYNQVNYFSDRLPVSHHLVDGHYVCMADESFNGESAAHIIYRAAQDYRINPRVLIVLLEKEQGLVTDSFPNSLQYRSATGYGCPDTAACDSEYYGFKNQVRNAAYFFRYILDNGSRYYPVGNNNIKYNPNGNCGSSTVYVKNRATSALYQYTPYQPNSAVLNSNPGVVVSCGAYGNSNFYFYFTRWFGDTHKTIGSIYFNDGATFEIKADSGKYLVPDGNTQGSKMIISSNASEASRKFQLIRNGDFYTIKHVATGLVLDVVGGNVDDGTNLQLYSSNGTCAQKWLIRNSGDGYSLKSECSYKSINVSGGNSTVDGAKLQINNPTGASTERWTLVDLSAAAIESGNYVLTDSGTKAADIEFGNTRNGTRIHTYDITYGSNQQYIVSRGVDGFYQIKNVTSGKVLDVSNAGTDNGTAVQLWDYNSTTCAQKWMIRKENNKYVLVSTCSGKALDVPNGNIRQNNQKLQIWDKNNTAAQYWYFHTLNSVADGNYKITTALDSSKALDLAGGAEIAIDGTNLQIWPDNNTNAQKFALSYNSTKKAYLIKNAVADRVFDVSNSGTKPGTNVQVWGYNPTVCAQFWHIYPTVDGYYYLISSCSNMTLDVSGGVSAGGTNVQIWDQNDTKSQKWKLTKL